ncbi:CoA-binding protein [Thermodesulfobacteriota bacterium]
MTKSSGKQSPAKRVTDAIFFPNSIAVIGASSNSEKEHASGWVGRLLRAGFKGKIYPINPTAEEICGLKAYPSVASVPAEVDYAILALAARNVPKVLEECINNGVKTVHCYAAGFAESGTEEGIKLQAELVSLLQGGQTRMIGPNCLGVYCPKSGLAMDGRFSKESGPIGFLSQTGTGLIQLVSESIARGLRFSKAVSFGNALDLDASDFLDYFAADEETKLILVYVEGINRNGRRFFQTLRECNKVKPVVLLKGGMSDSGASVASSHTGSLAGSRQVWQTLFRQTRVCAVQSFEEAVEQMVALVHMPPSNGRRVGIVGRGGGIGVTTTDICEREGLVVPEFTAETREKLSKLTPPGGGSIVRNPVEIGLGKFGISENYVEALNVVDADPNIDLAITFLDPEQYLEHIKDDWVEGAEKSLIEASKQVKKPLIVVFKPGISSIVFEWTRQLQSACHKAGLPAYKSLETAIKAASKHIEYNEFKSSISSSD